MTPEEQAVVKNRLREVAEILYRNTSPEELKTFKTVEISIREHLLETVAPEIGNFFSAQQEETKQEEKEPSKPVSVKLSFLANKQSGSN